jgi:hypothetical protein
MRPRSFCDALLQRAGVLKVFAFRPILRGMAKKPLGGPIGQVEAPDEAAAIEKGVAEFKVQPNR